MHQVDALEPLAERVQRAHRHLQRCLGILVEFTAGRAAPRALRQPRSGWLRREGTALGERAQGFEAARLIVEQQREERAVTREIDQRVVRGGHFARHAAQRCFETVAIPSRHVVAQSSGRALHRMHAALGALESAQRVASASEHAVDLTEPLADSGIILGAVLGFDPRRLEERRRFRPDTGKRR